MKISYVTSRNCSFEMALAQTQCSLLKASHLSQLALCSIQLIFRTRGQAQAATTGKAPLAFLDVMLPRMSVYLSGCLFPYASAEPLNDGWSGGGAGSTTTSLSSLYGSLIWLCVLNFYHISFLKQLQTTTPPSASTNTFSVCSFRSRISSRAWDSQSNWHQECLSQAQTYMGGLKPNHYELPDVQTMLWWGCADAHVIYFLSTFKLDIQIPECLWRLRGLVCSSLSICHCSCQ